MTVSLYYFIKLKRKMCLRPYPTNNSFFLDGDAVCGMRTAHYFGSRLKTAEGGPTPGGGVGEDEEEYLHEDYAPFQCLAPGCQATFTQLLDSEAHYATKHRHSCSVCNKSLPSNHFLEIHIMENHDSFFQVRNQAQKVRPKKMAIFVILDSRRTLILCFTNSH